MEDKKAIKNEVVMIRQFKIKIKSEGKYKSKYKRDEEKKVSKHNEKGVK